MAGFHPADAEIGDVEPHHMGVAQVGHEGDTALVLPIPADVAAGNPTTVLKAAGQGLEAEHKIIDNSAVLLGQAGKHDQPGKVAQS